MKIPLVVADLLHEDRQKDRHDEANCHSSQIREDA
jgi:hypothetical protein